MNSFSINRFWKTFCWVVTTNFRHLLAWTLAYSLITFLCELIFWKLSEEHTPGYIVAAVAEFFSTFIVIAVGIGFSLVFYDLNKKPRREAFLMLPASNLEKYLSSVIYWTVIWTICVLISFAVGDTLRMIFRGLTYGDEWLSAIPGVMVNLNLYDDCFMSGADLLYTVMKIITVTTLVLWLHSLYILGGTLMRKYAFVVTSVLFILCVVALGKTMNYFDLSMFKVDWVEEDGHYVSSEVGAIAYVLSIVLLLLTCFNYWASFQIFKGFQLITNKWTNYDILKR